MEFENKILSKEIGAILYASGRSVGTAESCTGGRIAEALIAVPGASDYFKGGIISYTDEVKERLLHVDPETLVEQTAVCEEVAMQMVAGALEVLQVDYAVAATGFAGPGGGTADIPVGTIWLACGSKDEVVTTKLTENIGRDVNLSVATNQVLRMLLELLKQQNINQTAAQNEKNP